MKKARVIVLLAVLTGACINGQAQKKVSYDKYEYEVDAEGNRHGLYQVFCELWHENVAYTGTYSHGIPTGVHKRYDSPGVIGSETTYRNGKEAEHKYYGNVKKNGVVVRGVTEHAIYKDNGAVIKSAWSNADNKMRPKSGELTGSKGTWTQIYPDEIEMGVPLYYEKYFDNDTTWSWYGYAADKKQLYQKSAPNYRRVWDEEGNLLISEGFESGGSQGIDGSGKENYMVNVNADRKQEEWDENGLHYIKETYPDLGGFSHEELNVKDTSGDERTIYIVRQTPDGETLKIEFCPEEECSKYIRKKKMYLDGELFLTLYTQEWGLNDRDYKPLFSQYYIINGSQPSSVSRTYKMKDAIKKIADVFPKDVFAKFNIGISGEIMALKDGNDNRLISPYVAEYNNKGVLTDYLPEDEEFVELLMEANLKPDPETKKMPARGNMVVDGTGYILSWRLGMVEAK